MKKIVLKSITLILALLLLGASLSSCASLMIRFVKKEDRPMKLYETVMENMNNARSITGITTMKLQAVIAETKITATAKQVEQILDKKGEMLHRSEMTATTKIDATTTTDVSLSGYQDGKMYLASGEVESAYTNKLAAPITEQEYRDHRLALAEHSEFDLDFSAEECKSMTCEQRKEDKKWIGTYTDFEKSYVSRAVQSLDNMEALFCEEYEVVDLIITVIADKKLTPLRIEIEFEFEAISDEADDTLPTLSVTVELSDINKTEIEKEDLKDFDEVDDLRVLDLLGVWVDNFAAKDEGEFSSTSKIVTLVASHQQTQSQAIELSFKNGKSGFCFDLLQTQSDGKYAISYKEGQQTVKSFYNSGAELGTTTTEMQEPAARYQVISILTPTEFNASEVSDIKLEEKNGQTVYTLHVADPANTKKELQASLGDGCTDLSLASIYTLYVKDGELIKYEYSLEATFEIQNMSCSYNIDISATYS